jgi:hypothetical protein
MNSLFIVKNEILNIDKYTNWQKKPQEESLGHLEN